MISQYNIAKPEERYGVKNLASIVTKRLHMRGFIVGDPEMGPTYASAHQKEVGRLISEGKFKAQQSVTHGMDDAIKGLLGMLKGENFGKAILQIEDMKVSSFHHTPILADKESETSNRHARL